MLNGRRRDHGGERAALEVADVAPGGVVNVQPVAFWVREGAGGRRGRARAARRSARAPPPTPPPPNPQTPPKTLNK